MKRLMGLLLCFACAPSPRVLDASGDIDFIAVLELSADGNVEKLSGLEAWSSSSALTFVLEEDSALIAGYSREELETYGAPVGQLELLADTPLEVSRGCVGLPVPSYARRLDGSTLSAVEGATLPRLTASWTKDQCPELAAEAISFENDCVAFRCAAQVQKVSRCRFEAELECELGRAAVSIDPFGAACLESLEGGTRPTCNVVVQVAPSEPIFDVASKLLFDVEPYVPPLSLTGGTVQMPRSGRYLGYAYDFAVLGEELAVAVGPGTPVEYCLPPGAGGGALLFLDAESLEVTRTATVPSCTTLLGADRGELYAVHQDGEAIVLSQLDATGAIIRSATLAGMRASCDRPISLDFAGEELVLVFDGTAYPERCGAHGSDVVLVSRPSLATRDVYNFATVSAYATTLRGSEIVLGDSLEVRAFFVNLATGVLENTVIVPREIARNDIVIPDIFVIQRTGRLLLSLARNSVNTLFIDETEGILGSTFFSSVDAGPSAAGMIGEELFLTGTARKAPESWPTYASRLIEAPMSVKLDHAAVLLGHGAVRRIANDARGRAFMLLPWEPRIVRLTPPGP
jgi:hypothetical protein